MDNELCKQLKDAGFPKDDFFFDEPVSFKMGQVIVNSGDGWRNIPTLSELIEACEDCGVVGSKQYGYYAASPVRVNMYHDSTFLEEGKTPEIAVAKLWLAIHSQKLKDSKDMID